LFDPEEILQEFSEFQDRFADSVSQQADLRFDNHTSWNLYRRAKTGKKPRKKAAPPEGSRRCNVCDCWKVPAEYEPNPNGTCTACKEKRKAAFREVRPGYRLCNRCRKWKAFPDAYEPALNGCCNVCRAKRKADYERIGRSRYQERKCTI